MPLSSEAQALFDHARNSLPRWLTGSALAALEWLYGFTEIFEEVRGQAKTWIDLTYLGTAAGAELDQHARDRGTTRRLGETDAVLRERLRNISDAVTEPALIDGVNKILAQNGDGMLAELIVKDYTVSGWNSKIQAYFTVAAGPIGFSYGSDLTLTMVDDGTDPAIIEGNVEGDPNIIIRFKAGTTTRSEVETLLNSGDLIQVIEFSDSPSSVLTADDIFGPVNFTYPPCAVVTLRRDGAYCQTNGDCTAFMSRGYRIGHTGRPMAYIFILPYGTDAPTANAVAEYLRQYGPGGYIYYVERRLNP